MFNSNNNKKSSAAKVNSNTSGNNLPSINMISEGTHVKGTLNTKNDIRIAGKLEGEAEAKGKLIIASTGVVDGDIEAVDADIAGKLLGEIHVSNKLILRQSAIVDGDIYTKSLLVEEGAQINGACRMNEDVSKKSSSSSSSSSSSTSSTSSSSSGSSSSGSSSTSKIADKLKSKEKEEA
ncbi:MAG: bactofilin family protein [Candidatus Cyclobacteriaceae bacterium M2_1C_046]